MTLLDRQMCDYILSASSRSHAAGGHDGDELFVHQIFSSLGSFLLQRGEAMALVTGVGTTPRIRPSGRQRSAISRLALSSRITGPQRGVRELPGQGAPLRASLRAPKSNFPGPTEEANED